MAAFVGLGSNVGDRARWLARAVASMRAAGLQVGPVSSLWLTEPVGAAELAWFLNCAVRVAHPPEPADLLRGCQEVEMELGRVRQPGRVLPRTVDLDVLLYDHRVIDQPGLVVPHPRLRERRFALAPLAEIAADEVVPPGTETVQDLLEALPPGPRAWVHARPELDA